ncbi:basic salivary proline-rich protein 2-like [Panthera pardus]|uniref:Basic salivary proline-rich protein 2-like n=1 Tax=Panthera pardus TaxID=9691 RepID=A0A9V1E551_PANPR|nr:basic salivary proline-rich protein 2-like [Panthera pardus]
MPCGHLFGPHGGLPQVWSMPEGDCPSGPRSPPSPATAARAHTPRTPVSLLPPPPPQLDARTRVLPASCARSAAPWPARSRGPPARGYPSARLCRPPPPPRCPRPGPPPPGGSGSLRSSRPGGTGVHAAGLGFGAPSPCCPPPTWRSRARGPGFRDAGVVGVLGCPALPPARSPSPGGGGAPGSRRAGVTGSGRAGTAAGWAPGRRAGALLQTRALMRAPRRGLSPWLPSGRAGGRFAPPLRAAVTAGRAPSPPLPPPRPPARAATCGPPSRMLARGIALRLPPAAPLCPAAAALGLPCALPFAAGLGEGQSKGSTGLARAVCHQSNEVQAWRSCRS